MSLGKPWQTPGRTDTADANQFHAAHRTTTDSLLKLSPKKAHRNNEGRLVGHVMQGAEH